MEKQTRKERIIYDNYDLCDQFDEAKAELKDEYEDNEGWEPTDSEVWERLYENDHDNWDLEVEQLQEFFGPRIFVLRGKTGTWRGAMDAGAVIRGFDDLRGAWVDCDYIRIYDVDGHFYIQSTHHDGTNHYEIRELNHKGEEFLERHNWDMSYRELHEALWKPQYSRLPNYAHLVFGCPRREAA